MPGILSKLLSLRLLQYQNLELRWVRDMGPAPTDGIFQHTRNRAEKDKFKLVRIDN